MNMARFANNMLDQEKMHTLGQACHQSQSEAADLLSDLATQIESEPVALCNHSQTKHDAKCMKEQGTD